MNDTSFFQGKRVTVFGLGLNSGGVGTVKFLAQAGAKEIIITDTKTETELASSIAMLRDIPSIRYTLGRHDQQDFVETDLVIKNPGIPWTNEFVQMALIHGIPVETDASIFFQCCQNQVIGVTGSKGKTTTALLIVHILEQANIPVARIGIGQVSVLDNLLTLNPDAVVVFELSSWRLSSMKQSPHISVVTNIYPDHLNYYASMEDYVADKENIFLFQKSEDTLVASGDDDWGSRMIGKAPGRVMRFSGQEIPEGFFEQEGKMMYQKNSSKEAWFDFSSWHILGAHNRRNALAATAALFSFGLKKEDIVSGLETFPGVPHRLEFVREKDGVKFFNDSAATIPEAAIAALRSFDQPVILIAGGNDKNLDFSEFAREIPLKTKRCIFFRGAGTEKLLQAMGCQDDGTIVRVESMEQAVALAVDGAKSGESILLSPGATSFGLFQNEFDRGNQFREVVRELK